MSAITILDHAPIGAVIEWSNGLPRPPEHHVDALFDWRRDNSRGILIHKHGDSASGHYSRLPHFTVRDGNTNQVFLVDSPYYFRVISRPKVGSVRIFGDGHPNPVLFHLVENRADANAWLVCRALPPTVVLSEVEADEVAADHVEGRAA